MLDQNILYLEDTYRNVVQTKSVVLPPAQVASKHEVFAEAILDKSSVRQKRHPLKWAISLGAHLLILFLLLLVPLYYSQGLDLHRFNTTLLVAPLPPAAAPPPPPPSAVARAVRSVPKTFTPGKLTAPSFVPKTVAIAANDLQPEEALVGVTGGVPGGIPGGQVGGFLGGILTNISAPGAPVAEGPRKPVRVGGNIKAPRLLSGPAPAYPVLAMQSRVSGTVVIEAIIDEHGNVVQQRAISGSPLLIPAALAAVAKRKYEPTILDGEATQIDLRVEVNFSLDDTSR